MNSNEFGQELPTASQPLGVAVINDHSCLLHLLSTVNSRGGFCPNQSAQCMFMEVHDELCLGAMSWHVQGQTEPPLRMQLILGLQDELLGFP